MSNTLAYWFQLRRKRNVGDVIAGVVKARVEPERSFQFSKICSRTSRERLAAEFAGQDLVEVEGGRCVELERDVRDVRRADGRVRAETSLRISQVEDV